MSLHPQKQGLHRSLCAALLVLGVAWTIAEQAWASEPKTAEHHLLLISIDGLRPDFYRDSSWPAPNLQALARRGVSADGVRGVWPTQTYPSHTTLVTGVPPAVHGIVANTLFDPGISSAQWHIDASEIHAPTLWDKVRAAGLRSAAVSWPLTRNAPIDYNLPEVWFDELPRDRRSAIRKYANPPGLFDEIERNATGVLRAVDIDYKHLAMDANNSRALSYLIRTYRPHLAAIHLVSTDTAQHAEGREGEGVRVAVAAVDHALGTILAAVDEAGIAATTHVLVVGDHGFADVHTVLAPNVWLAREGLAGEVQKADSWLAAFHAAGGMAFLHLKNAQDKALLERVSAALKRLPQDEAAGFDVLEGEALRKQGGDPSAVLALVARPGFLFSSSSRGPARKSAHGGSHGHHPDYPDLRTGFILAGHGIPGGKNVGLIKLEDVAPVAAKLLSLPAFEQAPLNPSLLH